MCGEFPSKTVKESHQVGTKERLHRFTGETLVRVQVLKVKVVNDGYCNPSMDCREVESKE